MDIKKLLRQIEKENERTKDQRVKDKSITVGMDALRLMTIQQIKTESEYIQNENNKNNMDLIITKTIKGEFKRQMKGGLK